MEISADLLKIIVCPLTKKPLIYDKQNQVLISKGAGLAYPIKNGIAILLPDQAIKITN